MVRTMEKKRQNLTILALLLLLSSGCAKNIHPGQIDALDGKTYDVLTVAQSVLDEAKVQYAQGKLPTTAKPIINGMGQAYNELRDLWNQYRAKPDASLESKILTATSSLNSFILQLRGMGVSK
jgi:hypothetical protein